MDFELLCRFMFHACITLMFKEGGREDRTAWTLNYFDVSFKISLDVQRGREDRTSWIWNYFDDSCM